MAANAQNVMVCRKFYLIIESAENLENVRNYFPTRAYAKVLIGSPDTNIKLNTNADNRHGLNPVWNCPMEFDISESGVQYYNVSVIIKVYTARKLAGDRYIGEVNTTVKDLYDHVLQNGGDLSARRSFSISNGSSETDGILKVRYSFGETFNVERTSFLRRAIQFVGEVGEGVAQIISFAISVVNS